MVSYTDSVSQLWSLSTMVLIRRKLSADLPIDTRQAR